jgi:ribosome-associated protein
MNQDDTSSERPSKSELKRESHALKDMGERLTQLSPDQLARMPLPENLREAVDEGRRIRQPGAKKRQLQYIGKLMRTLDAEPIREALAELDLKSARSAARHHQAERWRERLLEDGDAALSELVAEYPQADRQQLRQLARNAIKEQRQNRPPQSARALFRYLRELLSGE